MRCTVNVYLVQCYIEAGISPRNHMAEDEHPDAGPAQGSLRDTNSVMGVIVTPVRLGHECCGVSPLAGSVEISMQSLSSFSVRIMESVKLSSSLLLKH